MSLEYTSAQRESARTILEMLSKHVREYMAEQGEWVECVHPPLSVCLTPTDVDRGGKF